MSIPPVWNLICSDGHKHWSPEPMVFVDRECGIRKPQGGVCHKTLALIAGSRPKPKPKKKFPKRAKLRKVKRY